MHSKGIHGILEPHKAFDYVKGSVAAIIEFFISMLEILMRQSMRMREPKQSGFPYMGNPPK